MKTLIFLFIIFASSSSFADWIVEAAHMKNDRSDFTWNYTPSNYKKGMEIIGNSKNRCYLEVGGSDRVHEIWIYCRKRGEEDRGYTLNKMLRCERADAVKRNDRFYGTYSVSLKLIRSASDIDHTLFNTVCFWND